ncbi:MAG: 3-methyl-2-oxobutanoate hydroxymethyltransferase [Nitrospirota bacterium]|nr:3-methyl-2-oxobutanoate hydroxymethyltransferase [Nitrospirota bacterium]
MTPERLFTTTIPGLQKRKHGGPPIAMVTAYDAFHGRLLRKSEIDIALVGDSLGMVVQGNASTLSVTVDDILYHTRMVSRGLMGTSLLVSDMPFLSYQPSVETAIREAGRLIKEGGAQAVKLEGGEAFAETIRRLTLSMIPVMGHIGLLPQRVHSMGGYKVQGRDKEAQDRLMNDARSLVQAGIFALVIEGIPWELARRITEEISVPTIGIGAGPHTNGQVLVLHDLLGWSEAETLPRFVRRFGQAEEAALDSLRRFRLEVSGTTYPSLEESYSETEQ